MPRRTKSKDDDTHSESQSPLRLGEDQSGDGESSGVDRSMPAPEEPPYFPEQWYELNITVYTSNNARATQSVFDYEQICEQSLLVSTLKLRIFY